ncbi:MAG: hypothetical protein Q8P18_14620 [Pseudomonadota bacterium]|nr:hypothetical protein [Pseudomonadota bacterium]
MPRTWIRIPWDVSLDSGRVSALLGDCTRLDVEVSLDFGRN